MPRSPIPVACTLVVALAGAPCALAVPNPALSKIPTHILLVGRVADLADTTDGAFSVVVHDAANNPVARSNVEVRLLNCPGARISSQAYEPGTTSRCDTHGVLQSADLHGEVRMTAVGAGTPGAAPGGGPCAQIFAGGVLLGTATVAYLDMDGAGGLGANDMSLWLSDYALGEPIGRSDFDGDGQLTANDLSVWLELWSQARSKQSAAAFCP